MVLASPSYTHMCVSVHAQLGAQPWSSAWQLHGSSVDVFCAESNWPSDNFIWSSVHCFTKYLLSLSPPSATSDLAEGWDFISRFRALEEGAPKDTGPYGILGVCPLPLEPRAITCCRVGGMRQCVRLGGLWREVGLCTCQPASLSHVP